MNGVVIHHTGDYSSQAQMVDLCYTGYSGLPGPLGHTVIDKSGTCHMVGWGRANHAGLGDGDVLQAVIDEPALPADNEANTDGNSRFYGTEVINSGDGSDPWPEAQVDAAARWAAALCRAHGWSERSVIGHKEWQPGKPDPSISMNDFRTPAATFAHYTLFRLAEEHVAQHFGWLLGYARLSIGGCPITDGLRMKCAVGLGSWVM
ncbi:hypothetical protein GCM10022284_58530 [Streptomyces hundungensis]